MKTRNSALYALGLAAAITLGGVVTADAQVRRRTPQRRIPVRKDVPMPVKADTVMVTRVDTVTVRRVDTVTGPTVMRYDTVTRMVYPPLQRLPGLYFGLGGGVAIPMNNFRNVFKDGPQVQALVGYFPMNSPFGVRADVAFAQLGERDTDCPNCSKNQFIRGGADVVLRMPLDRTSKLNPVIYAFAGGGLARFSKITDSRQIYYHADGRTLYGVNVSGTHGYYDVGPGISMNVGRLKMFAEGKYITTFTKNTCVAVATGGGCTTATRLGTADAGGKGGRSHLFPVTVGLQFY